MRGTHVPILYQLTPGTSFYNATDTKDPATGRWRICFTYAWEVEDFATWYEWCTWADDPTPPPPPEPPPVSHAFPPCPATSFPDVTIGEWLLVSGFAPPCLTAATFDLTWDASLGPWGGWVGAYTACGPPGIVVAIYPYLASAFGMQWRADVNGPGWYQMLGWDIPCGIKDFESAVFTMPGMPAPGAQVRFRFTGS